MSKLRDISTGSHIPGNKNKQVILLKSVSHLFCTGTNYYVHKLKPR